MEKFHGREQKGTPNTFYNRYITQEKWYLILQLHLKTVYHQENENKQNL